MKRYLEHIRTKEPHHRRNHALQVASVVTAVVFVAWITTLGVRLAQAPQEQPAGDEQTAAAFAPYQPTGLSGRADNMLEVATTSGLNY